MKGRWIFLVVTIVAVAAGQAGERDAEPMVDLAVECPSIVIDLRYGTVRNTTGLTLYPRETRCWVRKSVAARLKQAQARLRTRGLGLKIWDAYRPAWVQQVLWEIIHNQDVVADPAAGGSMHTRGVAVDVTLVDQFGRELRMPTDFDDFTPSATSLYRGEDKTIRRNLSLLQDAMSYAGFETIRDEWWHFVAQDYKKYGPAKIETERGF